MPIITADQAKDSYDVVVVGSGAGGGQAAYTFAMEGAKVVMLESGRNYDPREETPMFQTNFDAPLRGAATPDKPLGFYDATVGGGWSVPGEPYSNASTNPKEQFTWWRARMLGGRTNHWSRVALRNGPYDFKPYSRDGLGRDWPVSYEEIAPYYDKVEMLIGVYGTNEGMENTPNSSPGVLLPPPKPRVGELLIQKGGATLGVPVVPVRRAVLSRALDYRTIPAKLHPGNPAAQRVLAESMQARAACFWATDCGRGCSIRANYQSTTVQLPPALATGNLDVITGAMGYQVTLGVNGKADGVAYIDKATGQTRRIRARVVVLAASSCETVRILLNSKSAAFPDGIGNGNGLVGQNIMDTVGASLQAQIPRLEGLPAHNEDGAGGAHMYSPWWLYRDQLAGKLGFARGYHIEISTGRRMPDLGTNAGLEGLTGGSYGAAYKQDARRYYGSFVSLSGRGEMIPNRNCFCELDPNLKDRWGIPVLRFHWKFSDHELRQSEHMHQTFARIFEAMGGKAVGRVGRDGYEGIRPGGNVKHEVGGTIMGSDPATSVTNRWGQLWDVKNLFVADGGPFCSNADKNPTLTILALSWRTSDYALGEMKRGNI